jgi:hypothetical protein
MLLALNFASTQPALPNFHAAKRADHHAARRAIIALPELVVTS